MAKSYRMPELVRGDFCQITGVPQAAVLEAVVEHDLAHDDAPEGGAADDARFTRRTITAQGQCTGTVDRVGDLVERVAKDDAIAAAASRVGDRCREQPPIGQAQA